MAESLLRRDLATKGLPGRVSSAGTLPGGRPATSDALAVLAERGAPLDGHLSRRLTPEMVAESDLVLCMAREHLREAAVAAPAAFWRIYTLKELVRRGRRVGARRPDEDLDAWLRRVHEGRSPADIMGASEEDDVPDPIGEPIAVYERTADELGRLVGEFVALVWGTAHAPLTELPR